MTTIQSILPVGSEALRALSSNKNEPGWLADMRQQALQAAGKLDLPKLDKTRIDRWKLDNYGTYKEEGKISTFRELPEEFHTVLSSDTDEQNLLIQRNSSVIYNRLSPDLVAKGVIFTDLETAAREHAELVQPYLMKAVQADENKLTALHTALWNGGVFLYVPKNVVIEQPLQALFISDDSQALFAPHVLVVAEDNSSVAYVDNYVSGSHVGDIVHNGAVEIFVKQGASVQYSTVHSLGTTTTDLCYRRAIVEKDGRIDWAVGEMSYGNAMTETLSVLKGDGSSSDAKLISVGTNDQKLDLTTRAVHFGRNSLSDMVTRAVMRDEATAIINGITKIEKGATGANGEQTERILMLSPQARGDANPILLIDEDEVKAGHAASVGQVNKDQVYYLMSRGLTKAQAERLIIYGFLAPIVSIMPIKKVEEQLQSLVERKLGQ